MSGRSAQIGHHHELDARRVASANLGNQRGRLERRSRQGIDNISRWGAAEMTVLAVRRSPSVWVVDGEQEDDREGGDPDEAKQQPAEWLGR